MYFGTSWDSKIEAFRIMEHSVNHGEGDMEISEEGTGGDRESLRIERSIGYVRTILVGNTTSSHSDG